MTVTAVADAMQVNKSTISRWVRDGAVMNWGLPGKPMVSLAEAVAAKDTARDPAKRRHPVVVADAVALFDGASDSGIRPTGSSTSQEMNLTAERVRKVRADASRAELENERAQKNLVERKAAEDTALDLGPALQILLDERAQTLAQKLVGVADYRTALDLIEASDHQMLGTWRRRIEKAMAEFGLSTDNSPASPSLADDQPA
mgnify:CR=1 FL=1